MNRRILLPAALGLVALVGLPAQGDDARQGARPPARPYAVSKKIGAPRPALPLPPVLGPDDTSLPLVVIDAGHGGHDPGALSADGAHREKDLTLALALATRDAILETGRARVAMTRATDRYLVLQERSGIARRLKADLFLSIHADAATRPEAQGASLYTLSEVASDREAAALAARENRADVINGIDLGRQPGTVQSILVDLTQRETMTIAADFARLLRREAGRAVTFRTGAHRFAGFVVLKAPDTPSLLFETGFISNVDDAAYLSSPEGQKAIGEAVGQAVRLHFARRLAGR